MPGTATLVKRRKNGTHRSGKNKLFMNAELGTTPDRRSIYLPSTIRCVVLPVELESFRKNKPLAMELISMRDRMDP